jgi:outer membrane protein OmpA-like peptidoglycan-associated protein
MRQKLLTFKYRILIWGLFVLAAPGLSFSDSGGSTTGTQFLQIPTGVRGAGMGGMFTAVADDVSTTYWNSAGLAQLNNIEINLLHVNYFSSVDYEFAGVALPLQPGSVFGLSAVFDFVPSFNSTDNPGAIPGSANDFAIDLGYGQSFGENLSLGIGAKFISSTLLTYSATGEAMDAGLLLYTKDKDWTVGLSVQNLGFFSSYSQYSFQGNLPLDYRAGLAYRFRPQQPTHFLLGVDLEKPVDEDPIVHTGGEFWYGGKSFAVAARGGYSFDPLYQDLGGETGASLGVGLRVIGFELNYALVPFGLLGDTQRFSITYRFGTEEKPPSPQPPPHEAAIESLIETGNNQEGTVKQATFNLKPQLRNDVQNWTFNITDPKGLVLKSYEGKGPPPRQIVWDGKDSNGNIVPGALSASYRFHTVDVRGEQFTTGDPIMSVGVVSTREISLRTSAEPGAIAAPTLPKSVQPLGMSGEVQVPSVSFGEGSSQLNHGDLDYLNEVAGLIRQYPNSRVYIEGHAFDEGDEKEALALSQSRADTVWRYLIEKGNVSPDNLYSRGHGAADPLDPSDTQEARGKNRRVDIVILTK